LEDQSVVMMSVDDYEYLLDSQNDFFAEDCSDEDRPRDVRGLSSEEMLDQINRDIAIWRADHEDEDEWEREMRLEEEFRNEVPFDPFSEHDYHPADWHIYPDEVESKKDPWHSTGSVLDKKYNDRFDSFGNEEELFSKYDSDLFKEDELENELKVEDIPFGDFDDKVPEVKSNIPYSIENLESNNWNEEPLTDEDDDPVFYEEPV